MKKETAEIIKMNLEFIGDVYTHLKNYKQAKEEAVKTQHYELATKVRDNYLAAENILKRKYIARMKNNNAIDEVEAELYFRELISFLNKYILLEDLIILPN